MAGERRIATGALTGRGNFDMTEVTAQLVVDQRGDSTFDGVFSGQGSLAKAGVGLLSVSGANTHTGGTIVRAGTLRTVAGGTLADTGAVIVEAGAAFQANTADTIGAVANSGTLDLNAQHVVASLANAEGGIANVNARLGSSGTVANLAGGTLNLSADVTAATVGNSGTLNVLGQRSITTGALVGDAGGRLVLATAADRLTLNQSGNGSYGGTIEGAGTFDKTGVGTLALAGNSSHTGTLNVQAGAVQVSGKLASGDVQVARGASLAVAAQALATTATLGIAGTLEVAADNRVGAFVNSGTVNGAGKLSADIYALNDGSVINANLGAGTLTTQGKVLLNGTSDAAVVNVLADSLLTLGGVDRLSRQAALTVDGKLLLGNGDQTVRTLAGAGSVDMQAYHLVVSNGGTFTGTLTSAGGSSLSTNGGALSLSGASSVQTQALDLTGGSSLRMAEGSTLSTGAAVVEAGSTLHMADTASFKYQTLSGTGTIDTARFGNAQGAKVAGALTFTGDFANQGQLAPGFSPGTVTIMGNYTESGTLDLELGGATPGTEHDQVRVGGTVTAAAGSKLVFMPWNGAAPRLGQTYQVIADVNGGAKRIQGAFGEVLFDADGVAGDGAAAASAAVLLDVATGRALATGLNQAGSRFADLGATAAQRAGADALFTAATAEVGNHQIDTARALGANAAEVLATADGVHKSVPEFYGAMADYGFTAANSLSRLLVKRAGAELGERASQRGGFFAAVQGDSASLADDASLRRNELVIGGEWQLTPSFSLGAALVSSNGSIEGDHGNGDVKGEAFRLYAKGRVNERMTVLGGVGHGSYRYDLKRTAVVGEARGDTRGSGTAVNFGLVYEAYQGRDITARPYASLDHGNFDVDGFAETGSSHRLVLDDHRTQRTTATVGGMFEWKSIVGGRAASVTADAALRTVLGEGGRSQGARLGIDSSVQFPISYESRQRTQAVVGLAGSVRLSDAVTAGASVDGALGGDRDTSVKAQLNVAF